MGRITLITGGARSGKSTVAQQMAVSYQDVGYIATAIRTDGEMAARIDKHIAERPAMWRTYECPYDVTQVIHEISHEMVILDCITVYITNLIFAFRDHWDGDETVDIAEQERIENAVIERIEEMMVAVAESSADFIMVTNEVGMGLVPQNALGRLFRDIAGWANQKIAQVADKVYLMVSGIQVEVK